MTAKIVLVVLAILAATVAGAVGLWNWVGAGDLSGHGWLALTLGTVFSLVIGIGLMALVFVSSRRGYDDPDASA